MLNNIPILGWILSAIGAISVSVPFWYCWTVCGIGAKYFYWLPTVYHSIPFWQSVGLFIVLSILKFALTPKLSTVDQTNNKGD